MGDLYDSLQRVKATEDENGLQLVKRKSKNDDYAEFMEKESQQRGAGMPRQSSFSSNLSLSTLDVPSPKRRPSGGPGKRATQVAAPLSTIPNVYFDDDFHLENPRIFDVVSERSEVQQPATATPDERKHSNGTVGGPRKALATNAILQEKISWYMDTIEVHLISAISTASSSFFAALGSLRDLHSEAADSVERIRQLRQDLDDLDKEMALGGLDLINKRRRNENLKQLGHAVRQLKSIVEAVAKCESFVNDNEAERALDAMDSLQKLIRGEQTEGDARALDIPQEEHISDLSGATALQGVDNDLAILRFRIGKTFESRFVAALVGDLRQHIETTSHKDTLQRWSNALQRARGGQSREQPAFPSYLTTDDAFRSELLSNLNGLYRAGYAVPATAAYRDALLQEIKAIIKKHLPSSNDDDADSIASMSTATGSARQRNQQDRAMILARNLRSLDSATAEDMLVKTYIGVGEALRRIGTQVKVLLDVTSTLDGTSPASSPSARSPNLDSIESRMGSDKAKDERIETPRYIQEELHQTLDMSNLLGQAVDLAQNRIVKVLRVRTDQSVRQEPTRFLRYFTLNLLFANECEAVSGRSGTALKNAVNGQIKEFIQLLGNSQQQELAKGMDADHWVARDFTETDEALLSRIIESGSRDPEGWSIGSQVWLPYDESHGDANGEASDGAQLQSNREKTRPAAIESETYILPSSALVCLRGLSPYLELITGIPSLTSEISSLLISYLQLFNSRCTQLILGAGATRIVGLKNITAKHLALASRALSFVAALLPFIRDFVRRHVGAGPQAASLMSEFERVRRVYQEHQTSISDKLVEIMSGRATVCIKAMKTIRWDEKSEKAVSPYMETLTKETGTLHRVLSKHLPESVVLGIMQPVFESYKEQLGAAFREGKVETEEGKERYVTFRLIIMFTFTKK